MLSKSVFGVLWLQHLVLNFLNRKGYRRIRHYLEENDWDAQIELEGAEGRGGVRKWAEDELKRSSCACLVCIK